MLKLLYFPIIHEPYIFSAQCGDYQSDSLFHGLRSLLGDQIVDGYPMWHMYDDADQERLKATWGKGFTIYGTLPNIKVDREDLHERIFKKDFNYVICPIHHTLNGRWAEINTTINALLEIYGSHRVVVVDGWDRPAIHRKIAEKTLYFKRELSDEFADVAHPISFSFPKEKIRDPLERVNDFAPLVPSSMPEHQATYIYTEEDEYYKSYQTSYFGFTSKKGREDVISESWDTMRHYEIIGNGCVPFFTNIEKCPTHTLTRFPKDLCIRAKKLRGVHPGTKEPYKPDVDTYIGTCKEILPGDDRGFIDFDKFDIDGYREIAEEFRQRMLTHLTTEAMAKYFMDKVLNNVVKSR